jgi:putative transposase
MILDNYGSDKHAAIKKRLVKHSRFHLHFAPHPPVVAQFGGTVVSLLTVTDRTIRCGVFHNVNELIAAIEHYLRINNDDPKLSRGPPPQNKSSPRPPADE